MKYLSSITRTRTVVTSLTLAAAVFASGAGLKWSVFGQSWL